MSIGCMFLIKKLFSVNILISLTCVAGLHDIYIIFSGFKLRIFFIVFLWIPDLGGSSIIIFGFSINFDSLFVSKKSIRESLK